MSTRSRGQVRKGSIRTASAPKLRKKVVPKLVSSRPKRTSNTPLNSNDKTSCQDEVAEKDAQSTVDTGPQEDEQSNTQSTCTLGPELDLHVPGSTFDLDIDINTGTINVDDFFAHPTASNGISESSSIDVLTSDGNDLLDLSGGVNPSNVHHENGQAETSAQKETTISPSEPPPGQELELSTPRQEKTAKKRTRLDSTSSSPDQSSEARAGDGVSPPRPKKRKNSVVKERKAPDRTTMTMQELIYYNPTANPMMSAKEEKEKRKQQSLPSSPEKDTPQNDKNESQPATGTGQTGQTGILGDAGEGGVENSKESDRIVPQLQIGADGNIVINEASMLMKTSLSNHSFDDSDTIIETGGRTTSDSFRKSYKITRWSKEENTKFFKALSHVGTDFTMMTLLVPKRSRKELKNKFKREEKKNPHLVAQALKNQITIPSK